MTRSARIFKKHNHANCTKQALKTFINLSEALLSARKYPAKVKRGIVAKWGETTIL